MWYNILVRKEVVMNKFPKLIFLLLLCSLLPLHRSAVAAELPYTKMITIDTSNTSQIKKILEHHFDCVMLRIGSIRNPNAPYNTSFQELHKLYSVVSLLERNRLPYIFEFTEDPGFSAPLHKSTIWQSTPEQHYFSQMMNEVLTRYRTNKYLVGVSVDFEDAAIAQTNYDAMEERFAGELNTAFPKLVFLRNFSPLAFENGLKTLPQSPEAWPHVNLTITMSYFTYPGQGTAMTKVVSLSRNSLLRQLEAYKDYLKKHKLDSFITLYIPFDKDSEILLQDTYEILKMLGLKANLRSGSDKFDCLRAPHPALLAVIDRHNQIGLKTK